MNFRDVTSEGVNAFTFYPSRGALTKGGACSETARSISNSVTAFDVSVPLCMFTKGVASDPKYLTASSLGAGYKVQACLSIVLYN